MPYTELKEHLRDVGFTIPTPFSEDGQTVLGDAVQEHVETILEAGGRTIIPCGNTGEYYSLTNEERIQVVSATVEAVGDDGIVMGGVSGSTKETMGLIDEYEQVGADAVMVMHPHHAYMHCQGLKRHLRSLIASTDLGVVIYKKGPEVTHEMLTDLSEMENFVGVKYAVNDIKGFSNVVHEASGDLVWMNGQAERFEPSYFFEGGEGFSTGVGNFVPEASLALMEVMENENWDRARRIRELFRPLEDLRDESGSGNDIPTANNVPVVKYGLELAGLHGGPVRDPLVELDEADQKLVEKHYNRVRNQIVQ